MPISLLQNREYREIQTTWMKLLVGWVKLNVDGLYNHEIGSMSAGGLVRDHNGSWQIKFTHNISKGHSFIAKA